LSEQTKIKQYDSDLNRTRWKKKKLDEVGEINLGQSPKSKYYNEEGEGPHFIQGCKNFGNKYPKLERFCSEPKRIADKGDVLISVRAPVGPVNMAQDEICIGRGVTALKLKEGPNEYLYYYLKYFEDRWSQVADGTTFNSITKSDLQELELQYPPLEERKKITSVLKVLDDKIEVNNCIIQLLEKIAQTIFKEWFVDFGPYEEFKDSELGEIPKGFDVKKLDDLVETLRGYSYESDYLDKENQNGYPMVNLHNIQEGGGYRDGNEKYYQEEDLKDRYYVKPKDLIIAITDLTQEGRVIGSPALIPPFEDQDDIIISQDVCKIEPIDEEIINIYYLYLLFKSRRFLSYSKNCASGTTVLHYSLKDIKDFKIALPPKRELCKFKEKVKPIINKVLKLTLENKDLTNIRDTLLPKLMSGEIRVNDLDIK